MQTSDPPVSMLYAPMRHQPTRLPSSWLESNTASVTSSYLCSKFHSLSLSASIRVHLYGDDDAGVFASQLLKYEDVQLPVAKSDDQVILSFGQKSLHRRRTHGLRVSMHT